MRAFTFAFAEARSDALAADFANSFSSFAAVVNRLEGYSREYTPFAKQLDSFYAQFNPVMSSTLGVMNTLTQNFFTIVRRSVHEDR